MLNNLANALAHPTMLGFFKIYNTNFYIDSSSRIWSEDRNCFVRPTTTFCYKTGRNGYSTVWLSNGISKKVHLIMADVFLTRPKSNRVLEVNHKDGNKANNALYNLEWVTSSGNASHAIETGLVSTIRPISIADLESGGSKLTFPTIEACADYLGICVKPISRYLKQMHTIPFMKKWDIVYEGRPWNPIPTENIGLEKPREVIAILALNKKTKEIAIFANASRASEYTKVTKAIIAKRLFNTTIAPRALKKRKNIEYLIGTPAYEWEFFYHKNNSETLAKVHEILSVDGDVRLPEIVEKKVGRYPGKPAHRVLVTNVDTNEQNEYASLKTFATEKGAKYRTVWNAVNIHKQWENYKVEYLI